MPAQQPCAVENCERPRLKREWCSAHYQRWRKHGDPLAGGPALSPRTPPGTPCAVPGCDRGGKLRRGWCAEHYRRWSRYGDPLGGGPAREFGQTCAAPGCSEPRDAKGYCPRHYMKWRMYGDPMAGGTACTTPAERFEKYTERVGDCIEWVGGRTTAGYGSLAANGAQVYAHRYAWEQVHGPIPDGYMIRHKCDNRPCVNTDHMELGTHADNMADMRERGRSGMLYENNDNRCSNGHDMTLPGAYRIVSPANSRPYRQCIACDRARKARWEANHRSPTTR